FCGLTPGVARYSGEGPISVQQAREILGHANVVIKPVIDLAHMAPADAYEVPDRLKEAVWLRNSVSCFPYASDPDPRVDIDHTIPYQHSPPDEEGGKAPPGQTRMDNLGGLTRRHHRYRTHGDWHVIHITQATEKHQLHRQPHLPTAASLPRRPHRHHAPRQTLGISDCACRRHDSMRRSVHRIDAELAQLGPTGYRPLRVSDTLF
ncbi:MAG: hypothetical protein ACRDQA_05100, partial [Nocardioidaceae bacterium]